MFFFNIFNDWVTSSSLLKAFAINRILEKYKVSPNIKIYTNLSPTRQNRNFLSVKQYLERLDRKMYFKVRYISPRSYMWSVVNFNLRFSSEKEFRTLFQILTGSDQFKLTECKDYLFLIHNQELLSKGELTSDIFKEFLMNLKDFKYYALVNNFWTMRYDNPVNKRDFSKLGIDKNLIIKGV